MLLHRGTGWCRPGRVLGEVVVVSKGVALLEVVLLLQMVVMVVVVIVVIMMVVVRPTPPTHHAPTGTRRMRGGVRTCGDVVADGQGVGSL